MGIEPTSEAWEALHKTLKAIDLAALSFPSDGLNWKLNGNRNESQIIWRPQQRRGSVGAGIRENPNIRSSLLLF